MKKKLQISLLNGFLLTLIIFTIAFLIMIFTSGDLNYRTTLWDALYFNASKTETGSVIIQTGVSNNFSIVFTSIFIVISSITYLVLTKSEK